MNDQIYERDYSLEAGDGGGEPAMTQEAYRELTSSPALRLYSAVMRLCPKTIVPRSKAAFDRLLPKCDQVARQRSGKIRAVVDYTLFEAKIELTLGFLEFMSEEERALLREIADGADGFWCVPDGGGLRASILFYYFTELPLEEMDSAAMYEMLKAAARQAEVELPLTPAEVDRLLRSRELFDALFGG